MKKKAQSQIISTILIIVITLVAIIIVWQIVKSFTEDDQIEPKKRCLEISLTFVDGSVNCEDSPIGTPPVATLYGDQISGSVMRGGDDMGNISMEIIVEGMPFHIPPGKTPESSGIMDFSITSTEDSLFVEDYQNVIVKIAPAIDTYICDITDEVTVMCV